MNKGFINSIAPVAWFSLCLVCAEHLDCISQKYPSTSGSGSRMFDWWRRSAGLGGKRRRRCWGGGLRGNLRRRSYDLSSSTNIYYSAYKFGIIETGNYVFEIFVINNQLLLLTATIYGWWWLGLAASYESAWKHRKMTPDCFHGLSTYFPKLSSSSLLMPTVQFCPRWGRV